MLKRTLVACLIPLLCLRAVHAGNETSGGGHGVQGDDGSLVILDLIEKPSLIQGTPVSIVDDPRTKDAAAYALARLSMMQSEFPEFAKAAIQTFQEMKWFFTRQAIPFIADSGLVVPGMVQPAIQNDKMEVTIDSNLFDRLDTRNGAALLIHELFLAKLGLKVPRAPVRRAIQGLFAAEPDWSFVRSGLNSIHPAIARGEYKLRFKIDMLDAGSLGNCYRIYANNSLVFMQDCWAYQKNNSTQEFNVSKGSRKNGVSIEAEGWANGNHIMRVYLNGVQITEQVLFENGRQKFSEYILPVR